MLKKRQTKAREAVLSLFQNSTEPLSLQELFQRIQTDLPKVAYSTIYRLVLKLEAEGRIHRVDWRERGSRYEWSELPHHHHIICRSCGEVKDVSDEQLHFNENLITKNTGYQVVHHSVEIEGICPPCQLKNSPWGLFFSA